MREASIAEGDTRVREASIAKGDTETNPASFPVTGGGVNVFVTEMAAAIW